MVNFIKKENFKPTDIILKDDASHLKKGFGKIETWYHDAIFENNYSMVSLVNILNIGKIGIVLTGLYVYKNSKPVHIIRKRYPLSNLTSDK